MHPRPVMPRPGPCHTRAQCVCTHRPPAAAGGACRYALALASAVAWGATERRYPLLKVGPCAAFACNAALRAGFGREAGSGFGVALSLAFVCHGAGNYLLEFDCSVCFVTGLASCVPPPDYPAQLSTRPSTTTSLSSQIDASASLSGLRM